MSNPFPTSKLGPVLLTGGNGFVAYHIIAKVLLEEPDCSIHSLDVNIDRNRHPNANVHYHRADLASASDVERVMQIARPVTIFHTASPEFSNAPLSSYHNIIVDGAQHLLNAAVKVGTVRALINTSTPGVINDNHTDMIDATEEMPILRYPQQKRIYCLAKADAEEAIQAANRNGGHDDRGVLTCSIRPGLIFGEHDAGALGKMFAVAQQGRSKFQMGNGQNPYDFVYAGNLADAHLLAAHALLETWGKPRPADPSFRVDGEVFNITNDDPWFFWDFQRAVASETGNPVLPEHIIAIPKWLGLAMGFVSEWVVWAISGGTRTPNMTREGIRFSTLIRTLNIDKAKRVLGYRPKVNMQDAIQLSVRWFMEQAKKDA
jgi:sterol-4alpha-carboxylate 3-dehydrogenase (decarboxylating)